MQNVVVIFKLRETSDKVLQSRKCDSSQLGSALDGLAIIKPAPAPEAFAPSLPILSSTPCNATALSETIKLVSELSTCDSFWKIGNGNAKRYWANKLVAPILGAKREREVILIGQKMVSLVLRRGTVFKTDL